MAARKWSLSSQNTAKLANLDMGYPPEISFLGIYLSSQIFSTLQRGKSGKKIAVITAETKPRLSYFSE